MSARAAAGRAFGAALIGLAALLASLVAAFAPAPAAAHQAALSVMEVRETRAGVYALRWANRPTTSNADVFLGLGPIWPPHCVEDWPMLDCGAEGLSGEIGFEGLGVAQSAAMLNIRALDGTFRSVTLTPSSPTARLAPNFAGGLAGALDAFAAYVSLGVEHILIGVDHLLFVLGLVWIARGGWSLVRTITAFTVAHSITLVAVALGLIGAPEAFVNAMIALSIVFVGVEVLRAERGKTSLTLRKPWLVAFGFGLLHGFGFASALVEIGLPDGARVIALAAFNVGVEIGQLAFVALVFALGWAWREMRAPRPPRTAPLAAYAIGSLASLWFVERAAILLGS